ncbi:MAG: glycosyltransferase [Bacteroidales bacterium]|nr:glycosyltransferase [Bacteroidales bacterium]
MARRKIDVLIIARPDHSYQIYKALSAQKELSFLYVTFGLFPRWLSFLRLPKLRYVDGNALILKWFTILHTLYFKLHWTKRFDEKKCFERSIRNLAKRYEPRIIHYWPDYCDETVHELKKAFPDVITLAEMYMPNPVTIIDDMKRVYAEHGLAFRNDFLEGYASVVGSRFNDADYIMVASKYVEETMKVTFPDKKYLVTSYGIQRSPYYRFSLKETPVKKFAYSGVISLEKGVDVICDYFSEHPEFELHLYGKMSESQKDLFSKYSSFQNLVFHGPVSREELFSAFQHMDVGIHPSRFDAYSLAVGEEIGAGLPVIVSDKTGNAFDIRENGWGTVFELNNLNSLDLAIDRVQEYYSDYQKAIDASVHASHLSYGEQIIQLYHKLV